MGCGGDGKSSGPTSYAGEKTEALITADEGGEIELGAVKVAIPAGALAADETISLEILDKKGHPDAANVAIDVYEFGPSMTFAEPVQLEFDLDGVRVPKNKRAVVAVLDEETSTWKKLDGSSESGGKIRGSTLHFSKFTVVLVLNPSTGQVGGQCGTFEACGGDLVGTWRFEGTCANVPLAAVLGADSPLLSCSEPATASIDVQVEGTVTFHADGTMEVNRTNQLTASMSLPLSCIEEVGPGGDPADICANEIEGTREGNLCKVDFSEAPDTEVGTGTYRTEGGILYIDEESPADEAFGGAGAAQPAALVRKQAQDTGLEYCVKGNTVTVREVNEEGLVIEYKATRQ